MSEALKAGDMVLSREEQHELQQLLADLYFPARANGPVPMQVSYWDDLMAQHRRWMERLAMTEDEMRKIADAAYDRRTYGAEQTPKQS